MQTECVCTAGSKGEREGKGVLHLISCNVKQSVYSEPAATAPSDRWYSSYDLLREHSSTSSSPPSAVFPKDSFFFFSLCLRWGPFVIARWTARDKQIGGEKSVPLFSCVVQSSCRSREYYSTRPSSFTQLPFLPFCLLALNSLAGFRAVVATTA